MASDNTYCAMPNRFGPLASEFGSSLPQPFANRQKKKDGKYQDARVLARERQTAHRANQQQPPNRWLLYKAVEAIDRCEQKAGQPGICRNKSAMRYLVGIENQKDQRDKTRRRAENLLPRQKHQQSQQQRQDGYGHARAKEHGVGVILEQKLFATQKSLMLELAVL